VTKRRSSKESLDYVDDHVVKTKVLVMFRNAKIVLVIFVDQWYVIISIIHLSVSIIMKIRRIVIVDENWCIV
jgi:hypothetical protein